MVLLDQAVNKGAGILGERLARAGAERFQRSSKTTQIVLLVLAAVSAAAYAAWAYRQQS
jgi:hypothetical protein